MVNSKGFRKAGALTVDNCCEKPINDTLTSVNG